jgi:hypothetical protein
MTSTDGINWTSRSSADDLNWNDITYSPDGKFVAVATTGTGPGQKRVMSSVNGINWFSQTPAADNDWRGVTFGLNRFVAVGSSGTANRVMVTTFTLLSASLLSFQAAAKDCQADLEWKTASEVNTSHFEVESSSDGRNFRAIGRVEAQGNGNGRTYGFRAADLPAGVYTLRVISEAGEPLTEPQRVIKR